MMEYGRAKIVLFLQSCCLIFIGLWDLFAIGLPPIDELGMIAIFPRVFPIIIGTLLLFIYSLLSLKNRFWFWTAVILSFVMNFAILRMIIDAKGLAMFRLLLLFAINTITIVFYLKSILLKKKNTDEVRQV